jgi:hypothetical protein
LKQSDLGDDDMVKDDVRDCMAAINYWAWYEDTLDGAMNRVLGEHIFDPLSKVAPTERARQIREALASGEKLSRIGIPMPARWSEQETRNLLTKLVDQIKFYESSGQPKIRDVSELTESLDKLRYLVQPLTETSTLSDAIKTFEENLLPNLDGYKARSDAESLIQYVLWFDTSNLLPVLFTSEVNINDDTFREYLRNIAWMIEDARNQDTK